MRERVEQVCAEFGVDGNPYLVSIQEGSLEREDFIATQCQFLFAVRYFSRPMSALLSRIPTNRQRVEILRNVWEEHGEGRLIQSHRQTFLTLLERLGVDPTTVESRAVWPEVDQFNLTLSGVCTLEDYRLGAAMLGIIEHIFGSISAQLGQAIIHRGWLPEPHLTHYRQHEDLDVRHSGDFFALIEPELETHGECIERGLRLGCSAFDTLYRGLYRARKRR
jgi:pyrroloquinoline-quinone synthase